MTAVLSQRELNRATLARQLLLVGCAPSSSPPWTVTCTPTARTGARSAGWMSLR